ncbi:MAG TPA: polysaccharide deacetylase family protein [Candidatus Paceibacterota bacterium]|nr:polysaccharide deacetylase family protein [Candidatus Paceibacterota bacterium]
MKAYILKRKKIFILYIILLIAVIVLSGFLLRDKPYFSYKALTQQISYLRYKFALGDILNNQDSNSNNASAIPVLLYHGITEIPGRFNITEDQFLEQMSTLRKAGYKTITMNDLYLFLNNKKNLPEKSFLLTFDDARLDSFLGGDPVLKLLDYNAVMFTPTESTLSRANNGTGYYLNTSLLKTMIKSGRWELGSHAVQQTGGFIPISKSGIKANFLSNKMWISDEEGVESDEEYDNRVKTELGQSKNLLEKTFNVSINSFAYPFSDYGQQSVNNGGNAIDTILKYVKENYAMAFKQVSLSDDQYTFNYPNNNMYYLHRIEPENNWDGAKLLNVLEATKPKTLPYNNMFGKLNIWKRIWGNIIQEDSSLILTTTLEKSGSGAFLDGTYGWTNYNFQTKIKGDAVDSVTVYSRYKDEEDNLSCTFTNAYIKISEKINGISSVLKQIEYHNKIAFNNNTLGMSVDDKMISCYQNGKELIQMNHSNKIKNGGIGLSIWDSVLKERSITFSEMSVQEK